MTELVTDYRITSDGVTVWVNSPEGAIARFGRQGIDIHTMDTTRCLFCRLGPVEESDWRLFQLKMLEHYGIDVGDEYTPFRFL